MRDDAYYLDQIEDAEEEVQRWRTGMNWAVLVLVASIAAILFGSTVDAQGLSIALVLTGVMVGLGAALFGGIWIFRFHEKESPAMKLRRAQREHRNHAVRSNGS